MQTQYLNFDEQLQEASLQVWREAFDEKFSIVSNAYDLITNAVTEVTIGLMAISRAQTDAEKTEIENR